MNSSVQENFYAKDVSVSEFHDSFKINLTNLSLAGLLQFTFNNSYFKTTSDCQENFRPRKSRGEDLSNQWREIIEKIFSQ